MFSSEIVPISSIRPPIVQMDPRTLGVTVQVAQDLGLSDGQVIQAVAEVRDNKVSLLIKGFLVDAPTFKTDAPTFKTDAPTFKTGAPLFKLDAPNWNGGNLKDGETVQLKANLSTTGWVLSPNDSTAQVLRAGASLGANSVEPNATGLNGTNTALNQNQAALGLMPNWSTRLNSLMFEPSPLGVVFELLMPEVMSRALAQPQLIAWLQRWNANRLSMAGVNPGALKDLVLAQSKSAENRVASAIANGNLLDPKGSRKLGDSTGLGSALGLSFGEGDDSGLDGLDTPKSMLASLSKLLDQMPQTDELSKLSHQVKAAGNELDSAQVHTVQQLLRGELAFHVVIPFVDADPVDLYFKKHKNNKDDDSKPSYSVDIHSKSRVLGEVWLNTAIRKSTEVDLTMWATSPEVAELARTNSSELGYELGVSGLTLNSFQIFNAPKPFDQGEPKPGAGSVLDTLV